MDWLCTLFMIAAVIFYVIGVVAQAATGPTGKAVGKGFLDGFFKSLFK